MLINLKSADKQDLHLIAKCHTSAFPVSLSSAMGVKYVSKMLEWYLSAPNKFIFWIEENGKCVGYCGGYVLDGTDKVGATSGMMQISFYRAIISLITRPWLFFHPELLLKYKLIFKNVLRKFKLIRPKQIVNTQNGKKEMSPLTAGLVVIGVLPNLQQKGLGTRLQQEFESKAKQLGAIRLFLTVKKNNERAINSYHRNGYVIYKEDATSFQMVKDLV